MLAIRTIHLVVDWPKVSDQYSFWSCLSVASTYQLSDCHKRTYWMCSTAFSFSRLTRTLTSACSVSSTSLKLPFLKSCIPFCYTTTRLYGSCCFAETRCRLSLLIDLVVTCMHCCILRDCSSLFSNCIYLSNMSYNNISCLSELHSASFDFRVERCILKHILINILIYSRAALWLKVSTTRVHGPSWWPVNSGAFFDTRQLRPSIWVVETGRPCTLHGRPVSTTQQHTSTRPSTRPVNLGSGNRPLVMSLSFFIPTGVCVILDTNPAHW